MDLSAVRPTANICLELLLYSSLEHSWVQWLKRGFLSNRKVAKANPIRLEVVLMPG